MNVKAERPRSRKEEQAEATRAALIGAGRKLFAEHGYAGVGTEEIVRAARVTRGALYHHFKDKAELFEAVFIEVERELTQRVATVAAGADGPFAAARAGAGAFLDTATEPEVQRIVLLDAPSVLGWERWREIGEEAGLGLVIAVMQAAIDEGAIEPQPVKPLAHLLMGALDEGAMVVARADDPKTARREVGEAIERILDGLHRR